MSLRWVLPLLMTFHLAASGLPKPRPKTPPAPKVVSPRRTPPPSPKTLCQEVTAFTLGQGESEYGVLRWQGHVFLHTLRRGIPVLQDPNQLPWPGTAVVCQTARGSKSIASAHLKAHLLQGAFAVPEGRALFMGTLASQFRHANRLELIQAPEEQEEAEGGARLAVVDLPKPNTLGSILILGYLEEGAPTIEQRNATLLHACAWVTF